MNQRRLRDPQSFERADYTEILQCYCWTCRYA